MKLPILKKDILNIKIFLRPIISENLPIGSTNVVTVSDCAKKDHEASLSVKLKSFAIILSNKKILLILITLINDENAIKIKAFHL